MRGKGPPTRKPSDDWQKKCESERRKDMKRREEEIQRLGNDPFQPELDVMAYIRAYYRVAAPRYVDYSAQCILCRMIPTIEDELSLYLNEQLGLVPRASATIYEKVVERDAATAARRQALREDRVKFTKAMERIQALNTEVVCGGGANDDSS
jgi:hypothetical protein